MIDLKKFCGTEKFRPYLKDPFSVGDFSYATNGHILVRMPRQEDVPDRNGETPKVEDLDAKITGVDGAKPLPPMPAYSARKCNGCKGSGWSIDCDDCDGEGALECDLGHEHECEMCDGNGTLRAQSSDDGAEHCESCGGSGHDLDISVVFNDGNCVTLKYFILLHSLPGIRWNLESREYPEPIAFWFDGGDGLFMPRRSPGPGSPSAIFPEQKP